MTGVDENTAGTKTDAMLRQSPPLPSATRAAADEAMARKMRRRGEESKLWWLVPTLYILFLIVPIYWLVNMSFKTNAEIVSSLTLYPHAPTLANYRTIFTDASWYSGYINSITYVVMN